MIVETVQIVSTLTLGLLVGSLLTEAMILVPYWRQMQPQEFLALHHTLGARLFAYFAPLTIAGVMLPVVAAIVPLLFGESFNPFSAITAGLTLLMLLIYFIYFKGANKSFETGSVGADGLPAELAKWANWHWARVVIGVIAFTTSLLALVY